MQWITRASVFPALPGGCLLVLLGLSSSSLSWFTGDGTDKDGKEDGVGVQGVSGDNSGGQRRVQVGGI